MVEMPYYRWIGFTRPLATPSVKVAVSAVLRQDTGSRITLDDAGRIVAVLCGRYHAHDLADICGRESSNTQFIRYEYDPYN